MRSKTAPPIAYLVKRYPVYSQTFIVNEILAHEAAGYEIVIFATRKTVDAHFQDSISRVQAPVHYLTPEAPKASDLWKAINELSDYVPDVWTRLQRLKGDDVNDVHAALLLAKQVRERNIGHIHAHFASAAATIARLASQLADVTYSFTAHAKDIFHKSVDPDMLSEKFRDARYAVTISDFNFRYLKHTFPQVTDRLERIYNGLELDAFAFEPVQRRERLILGVGRLVEKKGFIHLIDACGQLADRGVEFTCEIIGSGPSEVMLKNRIQELGLETKVALVGPRPQREVKDRLRQATVFAAPCVMAEDGDRDGLPTVLLEAMALGTPCVSTDVTGIPEVVKHADTGLMVRQSDAVDLAGAIHTLLEDEELNRMIARNARALIEREFDIHKNAGLLRNLLMKVDPLPVADPV